MLYIYDCLTFHLTMFYENYAQLSSNLIEIVNLKCKTKSK